MVALTLHLTNGQLNKLKNSKTFQIKNSQLTGNGGGTRVDLDVPKTFHTKVKRAMTKGSGLRIPKSILDGAKNEVIKFGNNMKDSAISHIKNRVDRGVDNVGKYAKNYTTKQIDKIPMTPQFIKNYVAKKTNEHIDRVANSAKDRIKNSITDMTKKRITNRISEQKIPIDDEEEVYYDTQTGQGFGSFIKSVGHTLAPVAKIAAPIAKSVAPIAVKTLSNYVAPGSGNITGPMVDAALKGKGLKGSMHEKMARLRAMRKTKGKGFLSNIAKTTFNAAAPVLAKTATNYAIDRLTSGTGLRKRTHGGAIVLNPRMMVKNNVMRNGVPQVTHGGSYGGFGYA